MTTAYTEIVEENPDVTLREFALRCARATGHLGRMREQSLGAPIPDELMPDPYYWDRKVEAQKEIDRLRAMTQWECQDAAKASYDRKCTFVAKYRDGSGDKKRRLERMESLVKGWTAPTKAHESLKAFMLSQLDDPYARETNSWTPAQPTLKAAGEWRLAKIKEATEDLDCYQKQWDEEVARTKAANEWLKQLRDSL